jgi:hypothetical protein
MNTKVFRVSSFAGLPINRNPQTPVKQAIVYLPEDVLQKTPNPVDKAKFAASQALESEIKKGPQFKDGYHWEVESAEVDLSEYITPNYTSSDGSKVWLN